MLDIHQINHSIQIQKELNEIVLFTSCAVPHWKLFYETYLQQVCFPLIAAGFVSQTLLNINTYIQEENKTAMITAHLVSQIVATTSITTAVVLKTAAIEFAYGPHLFLLGIGLAMMETISKLLPKLLSYFQLENKDSAEANALMQEIKQELFALMLQTTLFVAVLTNFLVPIMPMLPVVTTLATALLMTYKLIETLCRKSANAERHVHPEKSTVLMDKTDLATLQSANDELGAVNVDSKENSLEAEQYSIAMTM